MFTDSDRLMSSCGSTVTALGSAVSDAVAAAEVVVVVEDMRDMGEAGQIGNMGEKDKATLSSSSSSVPPIHDNESFSSTANGEMELLQSVEQSISQLAGSLFANQVRNRQIMPTWLTYALPSDTKHSSSSSSSSSSTSETSQIAFNVQSSAAFNRHTLAGVRKRPLSKSATTWSERESDRVRQRRDRVRRAMSKRSGGLDMALSRQHQRMLERLIPAATAAAGRRVPRSTNALRATVSAMRRTNGVSGSNGIGDRNGSRENNAISSIAVTTTDNHNGEPVTDSLVDIFVAILLEPIQFTVVAGGGDDTSLRLFPFGNSRMAQFNVPGSRLSDEELMAIQYLGMTAERWADADEYLGSDVRGVGETLMGTYIVNDAFDLSLDRVRIIEALRETLLYSAGEHIIVRHVVEAALAAAAAVPEIMRAGYYEALVHMAYMTRLAPLPPPSSPMERSTPLTVAMARELTARLHIRSIDAKVYEDLLGKQALAVDRESFESARRDSFGK